MPKKVRIPTPLRKFTNNDEVVQVNATTMNRTAPKKQFPISLAASLPAEHVLKTAALFDTQRVAHRSGMLRRSRAARLRRGRGGSPR